MNPTTNKPTLQQQNGHRSPSTAARTVPGSRRRKRRGYTPAIDHRRPIERVLARLDHTTPSPRGQYLVICPAHVDSKPSLSIKEDSSGKVLLHCHAGCSLEEILKALGLTKADLFPPRTGRRNGHAAVPAPAAKNGDVDSQLQRRKSPVSAKKAGKRRSHPRPRTKGERLARKFAKALTTENCQHLADELDLPPEALRALGVGWRKTDKGGVYTFPEHDGDGRVIGINIRALTGKKWMIKGSKRGLYLPTGWRDRKGPIYIVEGASCAAALTAMGKAGIGRPSAASGAELLADLLRKIPTKRKIIVLGEYDRKTDGSWPGRDGAWAVAQELTNLLARPVAATFPPNGAKDAREWYRKERLRRKSR